MKGGWSIVQFWGLNKVCLPGVGRGKEDVTMRVYPLLLEPVRKLGSSAVNPAHH